METDSDKMAPKDLLCYRIIVVTSDKWSLCNSDITGSIKQSAQNDAWQVLQRDILWSWEHDVVWLHVMISTSSVLTVLEYRLHYLFCLTSSLTCFSSTIKLGAVAAWLDQFAHPVYAVIYYCLSSNIISSSPGGSCYYSSDRDCYSCASKGWQVSISII